MNPACPACRATTEPVRWDDVQGFRCSACRGHVISAAQVEQFLDRHGGANKLGAFVVMAREAAPTTRDLMCPDCGTNSYRVLPAGGVELDTCASCLGLWLDDGEAEVYLRQARLRKGAGRAIQYTVTTVDGLGAIADLLNTLFHL